MMTVIISLAAFVIVTYLAVRLEQWVVRRTVERILVSVLSNPQTVGLVRCTHMDGNNCPPWWIPEEHADYPVSWCPWCGEEVRQRQIAGGSE